MNIALILSGGTGTRLGGDIPKQYLLVNGKMVITYALDTFVHSSDIDAIQIVANPIWNQSILDELQLVGGNDKFLGFSCPGENRQLSIYNGLMDIKNYLQNNMGNDGAKEHYVMIHDAARPMISTTMISNCFTAVVGHDGVLPVLPMKDTVYESADGQHITSLLNRSKIFAGQAPEVFALDKYISANQKLIPERIMSINGSTEPAILDGMDITMIPGDEDNFKITTKADLTRFIEIVQGRAMRGEIL